MTKGRDWSEGSVVDKDNQGFLARPEVKDGRGAGSPLVPAESRALPTRDFRLLTPRSMETTFVAAGQQVHGALSDGSPRKTDSIAILLCINSLKCIKVKEISLRIEKK